MEENTDNTDTIPIPVLDVERKTVPIICPRCNAITGVVKWHVERNATENDNTGLPETCSVCGKPFEDGEGRFRKPDFIYCVDCYKGPDTNFMEVCEKSELA
jgi:hypothetical protein